MTKQKQSSQTPTRQRADLPGTDLRKSEMMAHLLDALEAGTDIGHYGRLTFVMVARHFLKEEEIVDLLSGQPGEDEEIGAGILPAGKRA